MYLCKVMYVCYHQSIGGGNRTAVEIGHLQKTHENQRRSMPMKSIKLGIFDTAM